MIQTAGNASPSTPTADVPFVDQRPEIAPETRGERVWRHTLAALPAILLGAAALVWGTP